jgi:hypothetical protein
MDASTRWCSLVHFRVTAVAGGTTRLRRQRREFPRLRTQRCRPLTMVHPWFSRFRDESAWASVRFTPGFCRTDLDSNIPSPASRAQDRQLSPALPRWIRSSALSDMPRAWSIGWTPDWRMALHQEPRRAGKQQRYLIGLFSLSGCVVPPATPSAQPSAR